MPDFKPYADTGYRRAWQITADLAAVATITVLVAVGLALGALIASLGEIGVQLEAAGGDFRQSMSDTAAMVEGVPVVGGLIGDGFEGAAQAGANLEEAGAGIHQLITTVAITSGVLVAGVPIVAVLLLWLVPRLRFARRAGLIKRLVREGAPLDLFALQALARRPAAELYALHGDPAGAWRAGDATAVRLLAETELRHAGVVIPRGRA